MYYYPTYLKDTIHIEAVYTIHYFEYYKNYAFNGEQHDFWELMYVDKGPVIVMAGQRQICLQQGQIIFHQPNEFHNISANGAIAPNTIVISFSCSDLVINELAGQVCYVSRHERDLLASIISEAKNAFSTALGDPEYQKLDLLSQPVLGSEQMIRLYLEMLLIRFIRKNKHYSQNTTISTTAQHNAEEHYFNTTCAYIEDNIDKVFTLGHLSQHAMVSSSYLERLFNRYAGMSVIQYCNHRKIELAKKIIREDRMNISQIAESLGFSSIHYFSRTFKAFEGMSPSQYGRSVKSLKDHSEKVSSR